MWTRRNLVNLLVAAVALGGCARVQARSGNPGSADSARVSFFTYPWAWTDERGERVTFSRWGGGPVVLTVIFTSCRANCPRTIGKLRALDEAFHRQGATAQFLLVTLDPETDTPERLRKFKKAQGFPDSWHLLVGVPPSLDELTGLLDVHVLNADAHIVHNSRIVVLDARGVPARSFGGLALDEEGPFL